MDQVEVLVANEHAVIRAGLRALLGPEADVRVVAEVESADQAARLAGERHPHVTVLDAGPAVGRVRAAWPAGGTVVLTDRDDLVTLHQALADGADGYVLHRTPPVVLVSAVRAAALGQRLIDPALAGRLVTALAAGRPALSPREAAVLARVAQGFANKEIAVHLGVSVKTVETYKARSMEKLGLRSRVDVVRHAYRVGWLAEA